MKISDIPLLALVGSWIVMAYLASCGFVHRTPASPCENMICEAVDFGGAVKIQVCAGPADLQRIQSEARQLRSLKKESRP